METLCKCGMERRLCCVDGWLNWLCPKCEKRKVTTDKMPENNAPSEDRKAVLASYKKSKEVV